jgi:hypothetical protein
MEFCILLLCILISCVYHIFLLLFYALNIYLPTHSPFYCFSFPFHIFILFIGSLSCGKNFFSITFVACLLEIKYFSFYLSENTFALFELLLGIDFYAGIYFFCTAKLLSCCPLDYIVCMESQLFVLELLLYR